MSPRLRYVVRRLLISIPVLLAMSIFVFLLIRLVPGDPVRTMLGFRATDENVATSAPSWASISRCSTSTGRSGSILRFDLGQDYVKQGVAQRADRGAAPVTLELTRPGDAPRARRWRAARGAGRDPPQKHGRATTALAIAGIAIPDFWLGIMLVLVIAGTFRLLPPSGYVPFFEDPVANIRYMILQVITLAFAEIAYILRRNSWQESTAQRIHREAPWKPRRFPIHLLLHRVQSVAVYFSNSSFCFPTGTKKPARWRAS